MENLLVGKVIYDLRKKQELTQEQLANFIGVSTAAVSKWESGISYPDITLLPVLAKFFNITIDRLLNFKIELSDEEIKSIFRECEALFNNNDLDKAINKSISYAKKYPSSYKLKLKIAAIFNMYCFKASEEEVRMKMMAHAINLCEDISKNSGDIEMIEQALFLLGALYQIVDEDDKAIEAINKIKKSELDTDILLASIYNKKEDYKKARELLQSKLFKAINDISMACIVAKASYVKDKNALNKIEKYSKLAIDIKKVFSPWGDSVLGLSMDYLYLAQGYLEFNESQKAINALNDMLQDIKKNDLNNVAKFKSVWCFDEIPQGEKNITMNLWLYTKNCA